MVKSIARSKKRGTVKKEARARPARLKTARLEAVQPKSPLDSKSADSTSLDSASQPVALQRISKGTRAQFHDHEATDQLFAIVTALAAEMSVAFDRIDTLERMLVAAGAIAPDSVESYLPDTAAAEARSTKREQLIQRVFAVFETYGASKSR
jgi:hypothetical protein